MSDAPYLRIIGTAEAHEQLTPTYEESLTYQTKLLGLWEQQQRVLVLVCGAKWIRWPEKPMEAQQLLA